MGCTCPRAMPGALASARRQPFIGTPCNVCISDVGKHEWAEFQLDGPLSDEECPVLWRAQGDSYLPRDVQLQFFYSTVVRLVGESIFQNGIAAVPKWCDHQMKFHQLSVDISSSNINFLSCARWLIFRIY